MNSTLTWPATALLSVLTVCISLLVWKGIIPSHTLFVIIGVAVGFFPHAVLNAMRVRARANEAIEETRASNEFPIEEVVTNNESLRPPPVAPVASEEKKDK
jgi:hypothetical protein